MTSIAAVGNPRGPQLTVGKRIRAARLRKGWNQSVLAAKSGVSRETIERLETRRTVGSAATLAVLARSLGVPPDVLSEDDDEEKGEAR